ncbi:hypothetical protein [Rhizobium ruizarguesonis]|uniref:hypothetical protein n=1 Tax=Rhizobium ruizarguesonis TaxID=2081791 RepID=UPI001030935B|nr:hypothetical protein [Rhizobium ruizarguesonis]TBC88997.1 hypothetical protein ELH25_35925 [Rhizobium ruizarguesonis]TBD07980.1 hypothetical protein ELH24_35915 [Rhizobium ruizarguesonis]TBD24722.1 hypothetical protein ELH19_34705 [Rhizobium ruizarguesonis]TBD25207.1 hypothetical protein ELH19_34605 [Rhizobium ruizarguesonis]TBD31217.1 hypothetical protein ELH18_32865 [Rhizobium ruizarguesonis]
MFKNLQEEMRRLAARQTMSVPLESDAEGYFDKECPDENCLFVSHTFEQTLTTIRAAAQVGDTLRGTLDADQAETIARSLLEKGMQDTVMSFQRLCEQLYDRPEWPKARRNAFQNLDAGSELWGQALGVRYDQLLTAAEMSSAVRYFQQRHLLAHQQGIVDADYVSRSGDGTYAPGQRLIIKPAAVLNFVDIIEKLGRELIART